VVRQACPEPVEGLTTNGQKIIVSVLHPFALSLSKGERVVFQQPAGSENNIVSRVKKTAAG
jgi:hypothetical protein